STQLPSTQLPSTQLPSTQLPSTQLPSTQAAPIQEASHHPGGRGAGRIVAVLLGALVLVLGGYLLRDALSSPGTPSGAASGTPNTNEVRAPESAATPPLFQQEPSLVRPFPEPNDRDDPLPEVLVIPTDYWGHRGSDAAVTAKTRGLIPRVVDEDGDQIDPDLRSLCRIIGVNPLAGYVPRGSTLELTCRRGK
ncbi:MAG: hypothetical protein ACRDRA_19620, partial [Pseudonocardiaceae bacterium]